METINIDSQTNSEIRSLMTQLQAIVNGRGFANVARLKAMGLVCIGDNYSTYLTEKGELTLRAAGQVLV